jgi:uncharacterized metal-binding protein
MASGKTHDRVTLGLLLPVFLVCRWLLLLGWMPSAVITAGTAIGGLLLSPDLDTRSRPFYRWGVFRFIWWPYQWVAKHRSALSHGLWLAPWLRLIYLSAVLVVLYMGVYLGLAQWLGIPVTTDTPRQVVLAFLNRHLNDWLLLGVGIWLGSLFHVLLDGLSSSLRGKRL